MAQVFDQDDGVEFDPSVLEMSPNESQMFREALNQIAQDQARMEAWTVRQIHDLARSLEQVGNAAQVAIAQETERAKQRELTLFDLAINS